MPALDTTFGLPVAATATPADTYAATADNSADHSSSGNEFSRMMDQALAPAADKKTSARTDSAATPRANLGGAERPKSAVIRGQAKALASSAAPLASNNASGSDSATPVPLAGDLPSDKTAAKESATPVTADAAKSAETVPTAPTLAEPLPVFQPLPFAAYFRATAGMENNASASAGGTSPIINSLPTASAGSSAPVATASTTTLSSATDVSATAGAAAALLAKSTATSTSPVVTGEKTPPETAALLKALASSPVPPSVSDPAASQSALPLVSESSSGSDEAANPVPAAATVSVPSFDSMMGSVAVKSVNPTATLTGETAAQMSSPAPLTSSVQVALSNSLPPTQPTNQANLPGSLTADVSTRLPAQMDAPTAAASSDRPITPAVSQEIFASIASRLAGVPNSPAAMAPEMVPVDTTDTAGTASLTAPAAAAASAPLESDPTSVMTSPLAAAMMQKAWAGKEKSVTPGKINATNDAGTGVAFNDSAMKKNENTNKVAGLDVKVLPGSVTELAREKNLPPHLVVAPVNAPENHPHDLSGVSPLTGAPAAETPATVTVVDLPSLSDARMRALERTHDMVSLHALRLMESRSDTLQVTIKPAVGTELSLELRHRNGTIEAQATVERGDFQYLNQHWPELQQKLEQRGIRLSPLGGESNLLAGDGGSQHDARQQAAQEEAAMQASAFAEFASVGNWGGATARLAVDYDGWESWA